MNCGESALRGRNVKRSPRSSSSERTVLHDAPKAAVGIEPKDDLPQRWYEKADLPSTVYYDRVAKRTLRCKRKETSHEQQ